MGYFTKASSVFLNDNEFTMADNRFDDDEQRFITINIGISSQGYF